MVETTRHSTIAGKRQEVYQIANVLFGQQPDWVTFHREVLGKDGIARRSFSNDEMGEFEKSQEYYEILQMVARLRVRGGDANPDKEPTRVITVRLPKTLHEALKDEANSRNTSMNQLCISKLLQVIEANLVPAESNGRSATSPARSST